ncbi:hypothetical protein MCOR04_001410 [Pyricularia oryzae]|nr:hypothetical protein MCOR04_001410 [Pyricularia oryzae]
MASRLLSGPVVSAWACVDDGWSTDICFKAVAMGLVGGLECMASSDYHDGKPRLELSKDSGANPSRCSYRSCPFSGKGWVLVGRMRGNMCTTLPGNGKRMGDMDLFGAFLRVDPSQRGSFES